MIQITDILKVKLKDLLHSKCSFGMQSLCLDKLVETEDIRLNWPVHIGIILKLDASNETGYQRLLEVFYFL